MLDSAKGLWIAIGILLSCLFINGCSTKVYYSTQTDPQIAFDKQEPLSIYIGEMPSITDKKFALSLAKTMVECGFQINGFNLEAKSTNCYLVFSLDTSSSRYTYTGSYTTYNTSTAYTNIYTIPIVTVTKKIVASILCKDNRGKITQVWSGYAGANVEDYDKYQQKILKNLVELVGKDFKGYLKVE
ncbi:hypothetical protein [Helicobacter himalayensis]